MADLIFSYVDYLEAACQGVPCLVSFYFPSPFFVYHEAFLQIHVYFPISFLLKIGPRLLLFPFVMEIIHKKTWRLPSFKQFFLLAGISFFSFGTLLRMIAPIINKMIKLNTPLLDFPVI